MLRKIRKNFHSSPVPVISALCFCLLYLVFAYVPNAFAQDAAPSISQMNASAITMNGTEQPIDIDTAVVNDETLITTSTALRINGLVNDIDASCTVSLIYKPTDTTVTNVPCGQINEAKKQAQFAIDVSSKDLKASGLDITSDIALTDIDVVITNQDGNTNAGAADDSNKTLADAEEFSQVAIPVHKVRFIPLPPIAGMQVASNGKALSDSDTVYVTNPSDGDGTKTQFDVSINDSLLSYVNNDTRRKNDSIVNIIVQNDKMTEKQHVRLADMRQSAPDIWRFSFPIDLEEGSYTVAISKYTETGNHFVDVKALSSSRSQLVVDNTNPSITNVDFTTEKRRLGSDGHLFVAGSTKLKVKVSDSTGLSALHASYVRHSAAGDVEESLHDDVDLSNASTGSYTFDLAPTGVYPLSEMSITLTDKAGNAITRTVASLQNDEDAVVSPALNNVTTIISLPPISIDDVAINLQTDDGTIYSDTSHPVNAVAIHSHPQLHVQVNSPLFYLYVRYVLNDGDNTINVNVQESQDAATEALTTCPITKVDIEFTAIGGSFTCDFDPMKQDGTRLLPDGKYTLTYNGLYRGKTILLIDTTEPTANIVDAPSVHDDPEDENRNLIPDIDADAGPGDVLLQDGASHFDFSIKDLLPSTQGEKDGFTSSVDTDSIRIQKISKADSFTSKATEVTDPQSKLQRLQDDRYRINLDEEGLYPLRGLTIVAQDHAGNTLETTLVSMLGDDASYDYVLVNKGLNRAVTLDVEKAQGVPDATANTERQYIRGKANVTVSIADPWFSAYAALYENSSHFLSASVDTAPALHDEFTSNTNVEFANLNIGSLKQDGDGVWTGAYKLPLVKDKAVEGEYRLSVLYAGERRSSEFTIDYTGPQMGTFTLTDNGRQVWNWLFSPTPVEATMDDISDTVSGISADSAGFAALDFDMHGSDVPLTSKYDETGDRPIAYQGDRAKGSVSFTLNGNGERIRLTRTQIEVSDEAGNTTVSGVLSEFGRKNDSQKNTEHKTTLPKDVDGFVIDNDIPSVAVSYDNNNVHNGKYYNANRTATVVVNEVNFDLIKGNDPIRAISATNVDGAATNIPAKAFDNPTGDLHTWVTQIPLEHDGDWTLETDVTDPMGHVSNKYSDSFVIDTVKPSIMVSFDNNQSHNGKYYDADRNAKVSVTERNFNAEATGVQVEAKDDAGNSVVSPSAVGWSDNSTDSEHHYEHTTSVSFSGEFHYSLQTTSTDMAGNEAQVVQEPEFVIDKTLPVLDVTGVEDNTAYSGVISPKLHTTDTNIDPVSTSYTLSATHDKKASERNIPQTEDKPHEQTISFPDFAYETKNDDVYTLSVKAVDMAGNIVKRQVTFSVNRFGSTYLFDKNATALRGKYVNKTDDITVTEINVSGLQAKSGTPRIARNSQILELPKDSYRVKASDDKGWSQTAYTFPAELFAQDGYYRVEITSKDLAGNLSQNTMSEKSADRKSSADLSFAVDSTVPSASALDLASGAVYYGSQQTFVVQAQDNMRVESVSMDIDGEQVKTWTGDSLQDGDRTYSLRADAQPHAITISVKDKAGNTHAISYDKVIVAADWWQYLRNSSSGMAVASAMALLVIAAISITAVSASHYRKANAWKRNPFGHVTK